ncbi:MAG: UDP-N-acetylglucosamine 2-epimerase (non-hydrolyzing) [Elusimicrobia bacterium]|nr:UDP-N-acetylglucosamine 2-epimerase (non-hydrolyzing) [Elusimicrobiota bacterium]
MSSKKVFHIVGARPNFMKAAPVIAALKDHPGIHQRLIHTGQHYDKNMSDVFFQQLGLPSPDINLEVGSGSQAVQTAQIMMSLEEFLLAQPADLVMVYGDVNSTIAAALVSVKLGIPVAHVEAGLRSFDRSMPEEINRILTDQISNLLFTPSLDGNENLKREGVSPEKIHFVGNVMIDTLVRLLPQAEARPLPQNIPLNGKPYALITLHRPSNVDNPKNLERLLGALEKISRKIQIVFPVHPRTAQRIRQQGLENLSRGLFLLDPLGYLDFIALQKKATVVITDSGGIQEETTFLGIPCLTLRKNTERPITLTLGTNRLVEEPEALPEEVYRAISAGGPRGSVPPLWDGKSATRIAEITATTLGISAPLAATI